MSPGRSPERRANLVWRSLVAAFLVALTGEVITLAAGSHPGSLLESAGVALVLLGLAVGIVLVPIGFGANVTVLWRRLRERR